MTKKAAKKEQVTEQEPSSAELVAYLAHSLDGIQRWLNDAQACFDELNHRRVFPRVALDDEARQRLDDWAAAH